MVPEQIDREIVIAAPVERVWAILTEAGHIGQWFASAGAEIDLRPGGALLMSWKEHGGPFHARIERVEPPRRFSYRWARPAGAEPRPGNSTLVEFTLTPEGAGTRLRVVESGFRDLDQPVAEQAKYAGENTEGWIAVLNELRAYTQRLAA